ncbi:helix-turn-helix domain-containing protein [Actinomadura sp. GC306]|uniref:MarR family transcriptional regulator n=1 Tax=Actinomadura sp. GC306 TaxID=2530367 RepID=UPI001FB59DFE|nr:helix-turn-helix domain-containing protein [Actinomadura sp. GC306]
MSQSALSRAVARLEKQGYVQRALCRTTAAASSFGSPKPGRRHHAEARETHLRSSPST